jgi:hypothetical protein
MDHDTGFAPHIEDNVCMLSGCKKTTIELWAKKGSWVIGFGGKNTGNSNRLIYLMKVKENLKYQCFLQKYPITSKYLTTENAGSNVLISEKYYYFGNNALKIPEVLGHIIIKRQGCKKVSDKDVVNLEKHIRQSGYETCGVFGKPNNFNEKYRFDKC